MIDNQPASLPPVEVNWVQEHLVSETHPDFIKEADAAQYKGSDYTNALRVERGISLEEAFQIAESDPNIDYFVYTKGLSMVLELPADAAYDPAKDPLKLITHTPYIFDGGEKAEGYCRLFTLGDVVFFKREGKWLGSAPALADVYTKKN